MTTEPIPHLRGWYWRTPQGSTVWWADLPSPKYRRIWEPNPTPKRPAKPAGPLAGFFRRQESA